MRVTLLGSGAGDGWPNPWCACASCAWARAAGVLRRPTAALLAAGPDDGALLVDAGPQAALAGADLSGVRALLVTHAHPDHLHPSLLLWREWARPGEPLAVLGPPAVLAACADWLPPGGGGVALVEAAPGDVHRLGGWTARVLAAGHDGGEGDAVAAEAVLFAVTAPDSGTVLYGTDTGRLLAAALDALAGADLDVVLLDETYGDADLGPAHLDLRTFPRALAALRARGAVGPRTQVVAVHLGHHNPPGPELDRRLAAWGARAGTDGLVLEVPARTPAPAAVPAGRAGPGPGAPGPPRRVLLLGGARSGKSCEAERRLAACDDVLYVATAGRRDGDPEWVDRVAAHRARRPASWTTAETDDVAGLLERAAPGSRLLVDCLSLWLAARLDAAGAWGPDPDGAHGPAAPGALDAVEDGSRRLVAALRRTRAAQVVLVSNEVGAGVVPATASGRLYRDLLGRLNAAVAAACDEVALVVAGRVLPLPPAGPAGAPTGGTPRR